MCSKYRKEQKPSYSNESCVLIAFSSAPINFIHPRPCCVQFPNNASKLALGLKQASSSSRLQYFSDVISIFGTPSYLRDWAQGKVGS